MSSKSSAGGSLGPGSITMQGTGGRRLKAGAHIGGNPKVNAKTKLVQGK